MFHKAIKLRFLEGTAFEVTFQDGKVMQYDMASLFGKYPQLTALADRNLFLSGQLMGPYGIRWNDDLDLEAETVYEEGTLVKEIAPANMQTAAAISAARAKSGLSQKQVAELAGIDQSDLSKLERGLANPSVAMLERIARALGGSLSISIDVPA